MSFTINIDIDIFQFKDKHSEWILITFSFDKCYFEQKLHHIWSQFFFTSAEGIYIC